MRKFYSMNLYKKMPAPLQSAFVTFKGCCFSLLRNGIQPEKMRQQLQEAEKLSTEQIEQMQLRKLRDLIDHAYANVPWYRTKFREIGFRPGDLKCLADLAALPCIDKTIVREHYQEFLAENYRGRILFTGATSGTTGASLHLKMDRRLIRLEHAFSMRQFRWAGLPSSGGRTALLRGDMIIPAEQQKPPYWRYDVRNREKWFSAYHISATAAEAYLRELERFDPHIIYAYPSAIFSLSQFAGAAHRAVRLSSLTGIVTSSETLSEYERERIMGVFGAKIFDWYGQFERVIFIGTCEKGSYHVFPDYGVTEFLPTAGDEKNGQSFELIGTGFLNYAMPLIRYKIGDTVTMADDAQPCGCGRGFKRVQSISGRLQDIVLTPDGRQVSNMMHVFKNLSGIRFAQIIQESIDSITVAVVPEPTYSTGEEAKLVANFSERIGSGVRITVSLVEDIPLEKNGKRKMIVSKINERIS